MESTSLTPTLYSSKPLPRRIFNRVFAVIYAFAISALLLHHAETLLETKSVSSFIITFAMLISDMILSFMWVNSQAFRLNPTIKEPFPENLERALDRREFPALDVFICTADPTKEPPFKVAATVLSVLAYDYPAEKLAVYVSDDGGSELTLFALTEAAEFGKVWLPFCEENKIMERCPEAYFTRNSAANDHEKIKVLYEAMKKRVENMVMKGTIDEEYIKSEQETQVFGKWKQQGFTTDNHSAVIQVILQNGVDKDVTGCSMPNLIYVSRQKSSSYTHHFKAGSLNTLLRVSEIMTNAPIVLTLDCDMVSNDPSTPHKMLCYFVDDSVRRKLGYVQFPVRFDGLNTADIYASDFKRGYHMNPVGMNGLMGPDYFGTGTFFNRRVFSGDPSSPVIDPEIPVLSRHSVSKPINDRAVLQLAHEVACCGYENQSKWGSKIGFRYGSLVEDYYTGYRLHCEGWRSIYCNPERPAFLAEMPITLHDSVTQTKRWDVGLLEVVLSKHNPLMFGTQFIGSLMAHCYSYYAFGPMLSFPIMVYSFVPQLALLNRVFIFPSVSDPVFSLYILLFIASYGQDCQEFILFKSTMLRWWNDQRMWLIRGLSSNLFGTLEYIGNHLGIATRGFNITNKVQDNEQSKRYAEGIFEFGVASPMFVPLSTAAVLNLAAFTSGVLEILKGKDYSQFFMQMLVSSYGVVNSWPVYEAMALRSDTGRLPVKITTISVFLAWALFSVVSFSIQM